MVFITEGGDPIRIYLYNAELWRNNKNAFSYFKQEKEQNIKSFIKKYKEKNNMSVAEKSISKKQDSIVEEKSAKEEKKEEKQLEGKKSNTFEEISNPEIKDQKCDTIIN